METIKYPISFDVAKSNLLINPIPIGENNAASVVFIDKNFGGNSQGHLRFELNIGSLSEVYFKIYYLTKDYEIDDYFVQTVSMFSGNIETISPVVRKITTSGKFDYAFTVPACDGIKVVFWGNGASNAGSSISKIHLALRVN